MFVTNAEQNVQNYTMRGIETRYVRVPFEDKIVSADIHFWKNILENRRLFSA